jgi:hypothetical protein
MAGLKKAVALTAETLAGVRERAKSCFMCGFIVEALGRGSELRDWPPGAEEARFPVEGQEAHIRVDVPL